MLDKLKAIIAIKDAKSKTVLRNAFFSLFIKGLNIAVNFLTIPLVLSFLSTTQYGIWLTLTAILGWFSLFDLGFGNGLRNHLTKSISTNELKEGQIFVSTTYVALSMIFGGLIVIFIFIHPFINWTAIFNAPPEMRIDINNAVLFAMCFLFVQFVTRLITTILLSFQRAAMADFANTLVQIFILIGLYLLKSFSIRSITSVAIVYSLTPVFVYLVVSIYFFSKKYPQIAPKIKLFKKSHVDKLLKLGFSFFVIQIAALVLYASDNFIITQLFSPADVTIYNISYKYFSIGTILFNIIIAPFWSMVTHSYSQGDLLWIKKSVKKLILFWLLLCIVAVAQLLLSKIAYGVWTNYKVSIPFMLSLVICIYSIATTYGTIFSSLLNGIGKIKLQLYLAVAAMLLNIPMAIFFVKYCQVGIVGIPMATSITVIIANIIVYIQYRKIINQKAIGIWDK